LIESSQKKQSRIAPDHPEQNGVRHQCELKGTERQMLRHSYEIDTRRIEISLIAYRINSCGGTKTRGNRHLVYTIAVFCKPVLTARVCTRCRMMRPRLADV
jgi:hypothetical protein